MKRLILSIFALFCAATVSAQQQYGALLINRVDDQSVVVNTAPLASEKSFSIEFTEGTSIQLIAGKDVLLNGIITKHSFGDLPINFHRTHLRLPTGWTSSICFGETCYSPKTDSLPFDNPYIIAYPDTTALFILHLYVPKTATPDSVVNFIEFFAQTGNPDDTIGATFVGVLQTLGVDQQSNPVSSQPKIVSLYPSPLIDGNSIKVKVNAPKEMTFSYTISDELGRSVAFGTTHQRLTQGENTYQISELAGLTNGSYLLKLTFGDGSIDTRSFQVSH